MAIAKEEKTHVARQTTGVQKIKGTFKGKSVKDLKRKGYNLSKKDLQMMSIEFYLSDREKLKFKRMSEDKKRRIIEKAKRGQTEEKAVHKVEKAANETGKEAAKEGTKKAAEAGASAAEGTATAGTSEVVKAGIKTARKAADLVKQASHMPDERPKEMEEIRFSYTSPAERIMGIMSAVSAAIVTAIAPFLIAILIPVFFSALFFGIFTGVIAPVADILDRAAAYDDETTQAIFAEAFMWEGAPYKFGGTDPRTGVDCSGFTMWCYKAAGLSLPRTAQAQYDATVHIDPEEAKPGDLVFFSGTYDAGHYITHVEIYAGDNKCYGAGEPVGMHDLTSNYYSSHFVCFGRLGGM